MKILFTSLFVLGSVSCLTAQHHSGYHNFHRPPVYPAPVHRSDVRIIVTAPRPISPPPLYNVCHSGMHVQSCTCRRQFSAYEFEYFYNKASRIWGDYEKLSYIKNNLNGMFLVTTQTDYLIKLIFQENARLDLAFYLFENTADQYNYNNLACNFSAYNRARFDDFLYRNLVANNVGGNNSRWNNNGNNSYNNISGTDNYNSSGLPDNDFVMLKSAMGNKVFSGDRLTVMKQGISGRMVTTNQAVQLINLFNFENDKLEAAKFLYDFTVDKQNFYLVNNTFAFSSSVHDLNSYLSSR